LQLLAGLLVVAGIPVIATVRILDANALRNEQARADAALRAEVLGAGDELRGLAEDAATRADDLSRSPALQRAFLTRNRTALQHLAKQSPGLMFYLHGRRVAGAKVQLGLTRSVSLALDGKPVGRVVASVAFDKQLLTRLLRATPHASGDRLLVVRAGAVVGSDERIHVAGRTIDLAGERYRGLLSPVPNASRTYLLAIRPTATIAAAVRPYQQRVLYAGLGSLALLVLVGLLFGGPILRTLGDFRRVASQASTDSLTGLANRWAFDEELALEWRRAERVGDPLALILLDIDNFKEVNDTHGHQAGDEVLRRVGQVLAASVRHFDLAARYGGEEFAVILPGTDLDGAVRLGDRIRAALAKEEVELPDGTRLGVTASVGAAAKGDLPGGKELVATADEALYQAKRAGKNRVRPTRRRTRQSDRHPVERRRQPVAGKRKTSD
jgi:diguanylate cyclase (GGDEF)-like protein